MDSKKILIVTPTLSVGGAEKVAVNLANALSDKNSVTLLVLCGSNVSNWVLNERVEMVFLGAGSTKSSYIKAKQYLRGQKYQQTISVIVESNVVLGCLSLNKDINLGCLVFRQANTLDDIRNLPFLYRNLYILAMKLFYRRAHVVVANSPDTSADLVRSKIVTSEKVTVIPNPIVNKSIFNLARKDLNHKWMNGEHFVVLNVGRLAKQKRQDVLIKAFGMVYSKYNNSRLIILGSGSEKDSLNKLILSLDLQDCVEIIDSVSNPFPYYKKSNLFCLTSEFEGFGNVLVEAMAMGLNIVSTRCVGGPRYILDDRNSRLVEINNIDAISDAIIASIHCKKLESKDLIDTSMEYSVDIIANEYSSLSSR